MIEYGNEISADEYNSLRKSVGWKELDAAPARRGLDNSMLVVVARRDGEAVGSARVIGDGGYMYLIADVMVRPDCQRLGVGKAMLVRINEWLEMVGKDGLCVMANLMATKGNEGFYEKLGFTSRPNEEMGAGMVKWINP